MKYNFHDDVRRALAEARSEAFELNHAYVGTEHMLLGMLRSEECRGSRLLAQLGLDESELRSVAGRRLVPGEAEIARGELPYTSRGKKVLEFAMRAARDLRNDHVGTEHLLLGLLMEKKGIAARSLADVGVTTGHVEALLAGETPPPREPSATSDAAATSSSPSASRIQPFGPRLRIEIDDRSDRSIYEQIVVRIQEAVAVGEVAAGQRLPPVRRLADQLDIAPGTVARAYSELERLGVVVTDGARGTRVAEPSASAPGDSADLSQIAGLLRPAAVAAFHMGVGADDLRRSLEMAMEGIFEA